MPLSVLRVVWVVWAALWLLTSSASPEAPPPLQITQAERQALTGPPDAALPAGPAQTVTLPDDWTAQEMSGLWRYELAFDLQQMPHDDLWALYIPRAGNRLVVAVNGTLVGQWGQLESDTADHGRSPLMAAWPARLLQAGANRVEITVQGERARGAGLSRVTVGPLARVQPLYQAREMGVTWGAFAMTTLALVFTVGAVALGRLMHDRAFTLLGLTCLLFAVNTLPELISAPPLHWRWWQMLTHLSYAGYLLTLAAFAAEMLRWPRGLRWHWPQWGLALASVLLLALHAFGGHAKAYTAWELLMLVFGLWLVALVLRAAWRNRSRPAWALLVGGCITLGINAHTLLVTQYSPEGYEHVGAVRYSLLAVMLVMVWLLTERYRSLVRQKEAARAEGAADLLEQKRLLELQFEVQRRDAHHSARRLERQRILRDIHDGMGLQLSGLLSLAQSANVGTERLTREVRIAIEQMRLLVDNADAFEGDVGMLLGQIRYQIGRRLAHTGTTLHWQTALSHPGRVLRPAQAVALQRLVFELTTNVLKHAQATQVEVLVRDDASGALHLTFADNGVGFDDAAHKPGIGLRSIHTRAEEMGARLERLPVVPGLPGTRYRLSLPAQAFET